MGSYKWGYEQRALLTAHISEHITPPITTHEPPVLVGFGIPKGGVRVDWDPRRALKRISA